MLVRLCGQRIDARLCGIQPIGPDGGDELDICQPHKGKHMPEVWRGKVMWCADGGAARGQQDHNLFVLQKPLGTVVGVMKAQPDPGQMIKPGFQRRRNTKVVDRGGNDHQIRRVKLFQKRVRQGKGRGLFRAAGFGRGEGGTGPCGVEIWQAFCEVACGHVAGQTRQIAVGQLAGYGAFGAGRAVNAQDLGNVIVFLMLFCLTQR